jgi:membrane protein DedA with SNARE-associated domain
VRFAARFVPSALSARKFTVLALLSPTGFISSFGYVAIFLLCVAQSCCIPTSSELTMGFAGVLAATGHMSLAGAIAVGAGGEVVGAYIAWAVGRSAGRAIVDRYGKYVLLGHHDLDRAEAWYGRHERWGVFGGRLVPVIRNFVALPAGVAEVPAVRFGLLTAGGSLLWDGAMAGIGYGVGSRWHQVVSGFSDAGYVLAVVAVGLIATFFVHRWRSYHRHLAAAASSAGAGPAGAVQANPMDELRGLVMRLAATGVAPSDRSPSASNERLTAVAAAVLFVLLFLEGLTLPRIGSFVALHVIIGLVLIPPVLVKLGSTSWRFMRYYTGHPDYLAKGPPQALLRVLAPFLVLTTVILFASGVALVVVHLPPGWLYVVHRYDFVLWFGITTVHVLAYVWRVPGVVRGDWTRKRSSASLAEPGPVPWRWLRVWLMSGSVVGGIVLAALLWPSISGQVHLFFRVASSRVR